MKRIFIVLFLMVMAAGAGMGKDFASEVLQVNSAGFPKIGVMLKVFSKEPDELKADNFVISEDKTGISSFDLAFQKNRHYMVLVVDRSSSIEPAMNEVKRAAASFALSMVGDVSMSVLSFASDIDFSHAFSNDGNSLVEAINKLRPWGGTALYDALYSACDELQNKAGRADLKTVVCLTDGRDSTPNGQTPMSTRTPEQVKKYAVEKGIRLITVGLGNDIDEAILKDFAGATGGWYLQTTTPEQLSKLYEALSRRMKLERYYQLSYTTPKPERDGTRREIEIASSLKGFKDQGKGYYTAPTMTVHKPEPTEAGQPGRGGKMTVATVFNDLDIAGPDSVFLTGPITPPPASPVFGLNRASLLGLSDAEAQSVIEQARARVSSEHQANYDRQKKYLDAYKQGLEKIAQGVEKKAAEPGLKDYEKPRIEYRRQYLQLRQEEVSLHLQEAWEKYQIKLKSAMDEMDFYQKTQLSGGDDDEGFFDRNSASATASLNDASRKYADLLGQHHEKMAQHFGESVGSRGAHVEHSTTIVDEEIDLPGTGGKSSGFSPSQLNVPSVSDLKNRLKHSVPSYDDDAADSADSDDGAESDDSDSDTGDTYEPEIPDLKLLEP